MSEKSGVAERLVKRRGEVMTRAYHALDAAPQRKGAEYIREMRAAAEQLKSILSDMRDEGISELEQGRTYRQLGDVYANLEPALGNEQLHNAKAAYETAESLLKIQDDELEHAKLNFNFGNTLRLIDADDVTQLQAAKNKFAEARNYFAAHAPEQLSQIDEALQSVELLLRIAPLSVAVRKNIDDMAALKRSEAVGADITEFAGKAREIMRRGGGVAGVVGQVKAIVDTLPPEYRKTEKFEGVQQQLEGIAEQSLLTKEATAEKQLCSSVQEMLKPALESESVSSDRAASVNAILTDFGRIVSADESDLPAAMQKLRRMREFVEDQLEIAHYLSHGVPRPPAGSRAAVLVELNWRLRRHLLEQMNRNEKGEAESKEALELSLRAARIDRRIYEAGTDNALAGTIEKEELRPLAIAIRSFSARRCPMLARPIWKQRRVPIDSSAVFYAGPARWQARVAESLRRLELEIMIAPKGQSYASGRWEQLQEAVTSIFDLRPDQGSTVAAVTYELGIALTLGKPVVVLIAEGQTIPFDVDVDPVVLTGGPEDDTTLASAVEQSIVSTYPNLSVDGALATLEYTMSKYKRPHKDPYVDQTLGILENLRKAPDPLAISRTLQQLTDYLKDEQIGVIHPSWSPVYPEINQQRLFHVMPLKPEWDEATKVTREACAQAYIKYIRGDEVTEPNVIRSIWEEIARATHVLVDLTGFNPNVTLELGIAHTLGKNVLMVGQGDTVAGLFMSIQKLRVERYDSHGIAHSLRSLLRNWFFR